MPLLRLLTSEPAQFTVEHVKDAFQHLATEGGCTHTQVAAFLTALKVSGRDRDPAVLAACAAVARSRARLVDLHGPKGAVADGELVCDIVGTGGDGKDTFNVSTTAAIIAAGAGARVAKHGNRASSSASGAADLLVSLDVPVTTLSPAAMPAIAHLSRFLFLFAPLYHPSMALVGPVRKELGFPTVFNVLGPLINPARPDAMVVGVHSTWLGPIFIEALRQLGVRRAWVVCGDEGLDEISIEGPTHVWTLVGGQVGQRTVTPAAFGLPAHPLASVRGGTPAQNAQTLRDLLAGRLAIDSPIGAFVVLNTAALLVAAGVASDERDGVRRARESIASGKAREQLDAFAFAVRAAVDNADGMRTPATRCAMCSVPFAMSVDDTTATCAACREQTAHGHPAANGFSARA